MMQIKTPTQKSIDLVQRSWRAAEPVADAVVTMFYDRLFSLEPSVRSLFVNDFEQQKKVFLQTMAVTINGFQKPQALAPTLERLGARHVGFMVEDRHYKVAGEALLWTLQESLDKDFTPELKAAWQEIYEFVSGTMRRGAAQSQASGSSKTSPPSVMKSGAAPKAYPSAILSSPIKLQPKQVALIQQSWDAVVPIADAAAAMFYERLFTIDPSTRPMFTNDFEQQKKKLMRSIGGAVQALQKPQLLINTLEDLGARHVGYLVEDRHYKSVGKALLWTLQEGLGEAFTPEISTAWADFYDFISGIMKRAAAKAIASNVTARASAGPPPKMKPYIPEAEVEVESDPTMAGQATELSRATPPPPRVLAAPKAEVQNIETSAQKSAASQVQVTANVAGALALQAEKEVPLRLTLQLDPALISALERLQPKSAPASEPNKLPILLGLLGGGGGLLLTLLPALREASPATLGLMVLSLLSLLMLSFGLGVSLGRSASNKTERLSITSP